MNLIGGVIIVGSLIWDDHLQNKDTDFIRKNWRSQNLKTDTHFSPIPIRYGRISSTREYTYSMIFTKSNEGEAELGQGLIYEFLLPINTFEDLERQSIALAIAEGIYNSSNEKLSSKWGSVGLLINPSLKIRNLGKYEFIKKKWSSLYQTYNEFKALDYKCDNDITPPIEQNGILTINWQNPMNNFDLLLATTVIPDPKNTLTPKEIADKMIEKKYDTYFKNNIAYKIRTYQDALISENLPNH